MLKKLTAFLSLFASFSTLICCAIPALLVTIGMGASLASAISVFPQLTWFSEHKLIVFGGAGVLLLISFLMRRYSRQISCPTDTELAAACTTSKSVSNYVLYVSVALYLIGAFFAFVAPILL